MKRSLLFLLVLGFIYCLPITVKADNTVPEYLRVGLVSKDNNIEKVFITNTRISVGYEKDNVYYESAKLTAESYFTAVVSNLYYVALIDQYGSYEAAKISADSYKAAGYAATPCNTGVSQWRVYLGGYGSESQATNEANKLTNQATVVSLGNRGVVLMDAGAQTVIFYNESMFAQIADADFGAIQIGDSKYRGRIELSRAKVANITAINVVKLDDYLCSVVPSEMPPTWHLEALKAQSVAARNYAVTRNGIHEDFYYGLCNGVHCQAYLGVSNESDATNTAVWQTTGKLAYYGDEIINAVYSSSSGGATESSENVWTSAVPYLRSVTEINEPSGKVWSRTFTLKDISALLVSNNISIGTATNIKIGSCSAAGRVDELILTGTSGTHILTKEDIRTFFSTSKGGSLESRNFQLSNSITETSFTKLNIRSVEQTKELELRGLYSIASASAPDSLNKLSQIAVAGSDSIANYAMSTTIVTGTTNSDTVVFSGKGWGHGVGMSQHGANGMAQLGYTYDQILKHYYTGIEVR